MNELSFPKRQRPNPLPYVLLAGLILGIVAGWRMLSAPPTAGIQTPTPQPTSGPTPTPTPLPETIQIVKITPESYIQTAAREGNIAPDFSLETLDGKVVRLADLRGKPVLINFWATWCPPCRAEMPEIQAAYEKYADKGLVVLAVDFTVQDKLSDVKAYIQVLKLTFPILMDGTGDVGAGLYGVIGLPSSFFIDPDGILRRIQIGAIPPEKLDEYLAEILPK
jgi:thiol-disulfide isomerase/thioredoxin